MIEVVITILVIALVAAYAIPKLLGPRDSANDGTAKTTLRAALTAAETVYAQGQSYVGLTATTLPQLEPSITANAPAVAADFPIGPTANPKRVSVVGTTDAANLRLCSASKSGAVFCVHLTPNNPTEYYTYPKGDAATTFANISATTGVTPSTDGF